MLRKFSQNIFDAAQRKKYIFAILVCKVKSSSFRVYKCNKNNSDNNNSQMVQKDTYTRKIFETFTN